MRIIQIIIGVLLSLIAAAVTVWALFFTASPYKLSIITAGICLYGCVLTPFFILQGESIIEDGVKLVIMLVIAAGLWKVVSWRIAVPLAVPAICGMLANQAIQAIGQKIKST